jgi:hypothetical protein
MAMKAAPHAKRETRQAEGPVRDGVGKAILCSAIAGL